MLVPKGNWLKHLETSTEVIHERERECHTNEMISNSSRYMTYEFILLVLSISMMQKSEAGMHQKQHMQKSWDARH